MTLFNLPSHRFTAPTVEERLDHLTATAETHGQALIRIERGLHLLLDRVTAIAARMDETR